MVRFLPFRALVPKIEGNDATDRVSPPYDVIDDAGLQRLQALPGNVTRITLSGTEGRYTKAREEFDSWVEQGLLDRTDEAFFVYRQSFEADGVTRTRTGIIGIMETEPYDTGNIVPHEHTFPKVKQDRLNLLKDVEAHCESIFGIYDSIPELLLSSVAFTARLLYRLVDNDGVEHEISIMDDKRLTKRITTMLRDKRVLIADGHHRYETALAYAQENPDESSKHFVLITLVASDDPGMLVRPTHRLIKDMGMTETEFLDHISESFSTLDMGDPYSLGERMESSSLPDVGIMTKEGKYIVARYHADSSSNALESIDAYLCQRYIIDGILKGEDQGDGIAVAYDHSATSVWARMMSGEFDLALMLRAPSFDLIWDVADKDMRMPKKSTYFYPKMWSGFVYYDMSGQR